MKQHYEISKGGRVLKKISSPTSTSMELSDFHQGKTLIQAKVDPLKNIVIYDDTYYNYNRDQYIAERLDAKAKEYHYDDIRSAVSYINSSNNSFAYEAKMLSDWRDIVWEWYIDEAQNLDFSEFVSNFPELVDLRDSDGSELSGDSA